MSSHNAPSRPTPTRRLPSLVARPGSTGEPYHPDTLTARWREVVGGCDDAPRITLDDARHTHATLLLAEGVAAHVVSRRLGHASVAFTLSGYAHVLPEQDAAAAESLSDLIDRPEADDDHGHDVDGSGDAL